MTNPTVIKKARQMGKSETMGRQMAYEMGIPKKYVDAVFSGKDPFTIPAVILAIHLSSKRG